PGLSDAIQGLIGRILTEMQHVWGTRLDRFEETPEQYVWLEEHYGITEEDDLRWQFTLLDSADGVTAADLEENKEMQEFLESPHRIVHQLNYLLQRYRSNTIAYGKETTI